MHSLFVEIRTYVEKKFHYLPNHDVVIILGYLNELFLQYYKETVIKRNIQVIFTSWFIQSTPRNVPNIKFEKKLFKI